MKNRIPQSAWALLLAAALAVGAASGRLRTGAQGKAAWEHKLVPVPSIDAAEQSLKEMEAQGWELAAVQPNLSPRLRPAQAPAGGPEAYYIYKRRR